MAVIYKKLWHLLIDKNKRKTELRKMSEMSRATMTKLSKGVNVTTDILLRSLMILKCDVSYVTETISKGRLSHQ